jgi:hypothetical protein
MVVASMVAHGEPVVLTLPPSLSHGEPPAPEPAEMALVTET